MRRSFTLNKEPHVADIDGIELLFRPEITGAEFLDAYTRLRDVQKAVSGKAEDASLEELKEVTAALREFITDLMLPESREAFDKMRLPDRVLVSLMEFLSEVYGSGSAGERPTGQSSGSANQSRPAGTRGRGNSR